MTSQMLAEYLGGSQALGREIQSDFDLDDAVREGLPLSTIESVVRGGALRASLPATWVRGSSNSSWGASSTVWRRNKPGRSAHVRCTSAASPEELTPPSTARARAFTVHGGTSAEPRWCTLPEESNVLVNPAHPEASQVRVSTSRNFSYDLRLIGRARSP